MPCFSKMWCTGEIRPEYSTPPYAVNLTLPTYAKPNHNALLPYIATSGNRSHKPCVTVPQLLLAMHKDPPVRAAGHACYFKKEEGSGRNCQHTGEHLTRKGYGLTGRETQGQKEVLQFKYGS